MSKQSILLGVALALLVVAGVVLYPQLFPPADPYANVPSDIRFHDVAPANALDQVSSEELDLSFVDSQGKTVKLADRRGKNNVVLIITRGYHQARCPYCTAQTSRLVANHAEFTQRGAEVLVVYPGPLANLNEFLTAVAEQAKTRELPFPLLYDESLKVVKQLGIEYQLAKPSTFIIDKVGNLRYAYIGKDLADRPSIKAILDQLDQLDMLDAKAEPAAP